MNRTLQRISTVLAVGCAGLLLSCSHETESPQPTGSRVQPDLACNAKPADREFSNILVNGGKFTPMPSKVLEGDTSAQLILPKIELLQAKDLAGVDATTSSWTVPDDPANPAAGQVHWISETQMSFDIKPTPAVAQGVYTVKVTNPDGSRAVEIPMGLAVLPPPMLTALKPPAICDDQTDQVVTIEGTNFLRYEDAQGTVHLPSVVLKNAGTEKTYTPKDPLAGCVAVLGNFAEKKVELCTSMQITVKAQDWVVTQSTKLDVIVTNPAPADCASAEGLQLTVNPPPSVDGVQPKKLCEGGSTLAITGKNFEQGVIVELKCGDKAPVSAVNAEVNDDGTLVTATFGPGATAGEKCDVIVRNPDSCEDRPLPHQQVDVVPGPILFYVDPGVVYNGINTWITLFSTAITAPLPTDAVVIYPAGTSTGGTQLAYQEVAQYPNRLRALVPKSQAEGLYDVVLKDDSGCLAVLQNGLRVTGTTSIVLKSVDPPFGWTSEDTAVTIFRDTASGTAFQQTPRVFLNPSDSTDPAVVAAEMVNVNYVDGDRATGIVPKDTAVNTYDVILVNPDGAVGVLTQGYKSVANGPPVITGLTPGSLPTSTTPQPVTLFGRNFADGNTVAVTCKGAGAGTTTPATTSAAPTCNAGACTEGITINTATLTSGDVCVVRLTNPDGAYSDYSAIGITTPSLNLADARKGTDMNVGRRALASAAGQATPAARFVYAIGGDDGTVGGAFDSSEFAPVDLYGAMGNWVVQPRSPLGSKRTLTAATTVGRYMYVVGGNDGSAALNTAERALILSPRETPIIRDVDLNLVPAEGLGAGEWRYRVSAVFASTDPDNPGGESLASDAFALKLPEIASKKISVKIFWSAPIDSAKNALPNVVAYRIYRNIDAAGAPGTEVLLDTVPIVDANTPLEYLDNGLKTPAGDAPLPLGSSGKWLKLPNMTVARQSAAIVSGFDPADANRFYVYALAGSSTPNAGLATYEFLPITIDPVNGRQTVAAPWAAGASSMSVGRFEAGAWVVDKNASSFVTGADTYIFIGAGRTGAGTQKTGSVEVGKIAAGGDLGVWDQGPEDFSAATAGYGAFAGSSQLYAFGGEGPSAKSISAKMLSATTLANNSWNAGALGMTEGRYLYGFSVQSAFMFLCGGQTTAAQASKTTELAVW